MAHNGNLTNADELREHIVCTDLRHLNTDSDSKCCSTMAHELQPCGKLEPASDDIFRAVFNAQAAARSLCIVGLLQIMAFCFRSQWYSSTVFGVRHTDRVMNMP